MRYLRQITQASGEQAVDDIRAYLQDQHANHNARWVCLVGDDQMIPWSYCNIMATPPYLEYHTRIPNDWCYCDLDGEWIEYQPGMDWAPEMWAGRVPCTTKTEAGYFVDKVLAYELNPSNGEDYDYLSRAFYESADEMTDDGTCEAVMAQQHPLPRMGSALSGVRHAPILQPRRRYGSQIKAEGVPVRRCLGWCSLQPQPIRRSCDADLDA